MSWTDCVLKYVTPQEKYKFIGSINPLKNPPPRFKFTQLTFKKVFKYIVQVLVKKVCTSVVPTILVYHILLLHNMFLHTRKAGN